MESKFNEKIDGLREAWDELVERVIDLEDKHGEKLQKLEKERDDYKEKFETAQAKVDRIESQLQDTVEQMESLTKTKAKGIDALQLLDVYLVLMEQVFDSAAHVRLLIMMHGAKDEYTRDELVKGSGISPLEVRQSLFELRNAGIVDYNEETETATLKMRFLE